jgi:TRAP-type C4-dicarboxylate transport system substrate-binding protein
MNLRSSTFLVGAGAALLLASAADAQTILRFETYAGTQHPMNAEAIATWAEMVEEATEGRIQVQVSYPPVDPRDLLDRVRNRITDAAWMTHGYTTGRFVLTDMVELPGNGGSAEEASAAYWRVYMDEFGDRDEHVGVTPLALFVHGPGMLHTRGAVESFADLQGLKVRTGGGTQGQVAERIGFTTVSAPATQAQEILSQGVADGIFFSIETINSFQLGNVVSHHYSLPGNLYTSSMAVVASDAFLDRLDPADREALMSVSGEVFSALIGATWDRADQRALDALSDAGNVIAPFPDPVAEEIRSRLADLDDDWIARAKAEGVDDPSAVLERYRAEIAAAQ